MPVLLRLLSALALFFALSAPLVAEHAAAGALQADKSIVMGLPTKGWPPYHQPKDHLHGRGILPDIFLEATHGLGVPVKLLWLPEKRAMQSLLRGGVDIYTKAKCWVSNPDSYLWSAPIIESEDILLFRRGHEFDYHSPEDLKNRSVGTVLGYHYPCLAGLFDSGCCTRMDANNSLTQMKMLQSHRTETAIINRRVALWLIRETEEFSSDQFSFSEQAVDTADIRFVFNMGRAWGSFIHDLDREIAAMRTDGRLDAILDKYR